MHVHEPLSVPQRAVLTCLQTYKLLFSPMFAGSCRYWPSCSEYAAEAVRRFGVLRGSALALGRLSRCHPLGASGYDPVPSPRLPQATSSEAPPQI